VRQDNDTATLSTLGDTTYSIWTKEEGIDIEPAPPSTHEPNGGGERAGQEVITRSLKMRLGASLPKGLWPEIVQAAVWLINMSPRVGKEPLSPNEKLDQWFRQHFRFYDPEIVRSLTADLRPNWSRVYAYGCRAYPLQRSREKGEERRAYKVSPRAHIGYLVGYRASNIYRVWIPKLERVITTRNVRFDESLFFNERSEEEALPALTTEQIA